MRNKDSEDTVKLIIDVSLQLFLEKGYENTTIQDIINNLGGLSKGAIYYHFKSKEDILDAVGDKIGQENSSTLTKVREDTTLNGHDKLRAMFQSALTNANQEIIFSVAPDIMKNPRFLARQLQDIFTIVAPHYVQPIIEEGIKDGSIQTDYPKELAEVIMLLANIWLNPMILTTNKEELRNRVLFYDQMLRSMGIAIFDEQMIQRYVSYCEIYQRKNK